MAEGEIQILITAVDNMSAVMTKVEANLDKSNTAIQKQTTATSKGFQEQTGNLLILGQAANSVDRIWSSYQNMQLRIENATERVTGAQDRLADAQYELNKLLKSGTASAEDLQNAQRKVESASRGLTISQNNLQRAQNRVIGTYIGMGMQAVTLIASFGKVKIAIMAMTKASLAFLATPLGIALAAIAVAVGVAIYFWNKHKKAQEEATAAAEKFKEAQENQIIAQEGVVNAIKEEKVAEEDLQSAEKNLEKSHRDLSSAEKDLSKTRKELLELQKGLTNETNNWTEALKDADDFMRGVVKTHSKEENKMLLDIEKQRHNVNLAKLGGDEEEIKSEEDKLSALELQHQIQFEDVRNLAEAELNIIEDNTREKYGIEQEMMNATELLFKTGYGNISTFLGGIYYPKLEEMWKESNKRELEAYRVKIDEMITAQQKVIDQQEAIKEAEKAVVKEKEKVTTAKKEVVKAEEAIDTTIYLGKKTTTVSAAERAQSVKTGMPAPNGIIYLNDFILKPNVQDVIVGSKNGKGLGGMTIIIEGDNYGVDANEIATALAKKMSRSIRI